MKSLQEQREPPQPRLAVPKHKVTAPRASQHPRVRAGSGQMNYAAEAQDQKWGYELKNGVSMENLTPPWPAVEAEALTLPSGSESHRGVTAGSYSNGREEAARSGPA